MVPFSFTVAAPMLGQCSHDDDEGDKVPTYSRLCSSAWEMRCTADFRLQEGRGGRKKEGGGEGYVWRCTNNKMTRTRRLVVNIFAAHKLLHVLLFVLCISRATYDALVALHIQCMHCFEYFSHCLALHLSSWCTTTIWMDWLSETARHDAHACEKWEWQQ